MPHMEHSIGILFSLTFSNTTNLCILCSCFVSFGKKKEAKTNRYILFIVYVNPTTSLNVCIFLSLGVTYFFFLLEAIYFLLVNHYFNSCHKFLLIVI